MNLLEVEAVTKSFRGLRAVHQASFAVRQSIAEATAGQKPRRQLDATAFWAAFQKNRQNAEAVLVTTLGRQEHDFDAACVTALMHALAPEPAAVRVGLVKWLSRTLHPEATRALARLALFSAEEEVRLPAIAALQLRRERDYTPILMQGLRYPLPAVARRAAEALVRLDRADVVPQLVALLDEPDPRLPVAEEIKGAKVKVVTELTRVNHLRSCMFCHAPANHQATLSAAVPVPGQSLGPTGAGYDSPGQPGIAVAVRFDVTYLRPDFSLFQAVPDASPWPDQQRFDYLVRKRLLSDEEAQGFEQQSAKAPAGLVTPYQRAVLFALRELTGRDPAPSAQAWRELLALPKPAK